jgi:RHS repeat-associated protein
LTNFFDGSFNNPLVPTFSPGTSYTTTPGNPVELDLPYTGRDHDLLTFKIHMTGTTFLANAMVAVQEVSGTWTNPTSVMSLTRSPTSNTRENMRLSLGVVPRGAPLRVRFSCEHANGSGELSCTWSNLRFANAVPDWIRVDDAASATDIKDPYLRILGTVPGPGQSKLFAAAASIPHPLTPTTPFLEFEASTSPGGGASANSFVVLRSPLMQLPTFSPNELTSTVKWARIVTKTATTGYTAGATIRFMSVMGGTYQDTLITIPSGDLTSVTDWTLQPNDHPFPTKLSGQWGWFEIIKPFGFTDHILGIDDFVVYRNGKPVSLAIPADQVVGACDAAYAASTQCHEGDPVNTYSGAFYLQATDLDVPTPGLPLIFGRSYVSLFADPTSYPVTALGLGWRHTYDVRLTLPPTQPTPGAEANTVIYEAPTGNRLRFYVDRSSRRLSSAPGVRATLDTLPDGRYRLITRDQQVETFLANGKLVSIRDAQGHLQTLTYYGDQEAWPGQLKQVTDSDSGQTLTLTYQWVNGSLRLATVRDTHNRQVTYTFDMKGNLASVVDLRGGVTSYEYTDPARAFVLTKLVEPGATRVLTNSYDSTTGQIIGQVERGADGAIRETLTYSYVRSSSNGSLTTTITRTGATGTVDTQQHHYRNDGTFEYQTHNGVFTRYVTFAASFAPAVIVDGAGRASQQQTTSAGLPSVIKDARSQTTTLRYDGYHRPLEIVSPDGLTTRLEYDERGNLTRSAVRGHDGTQLTSIATYTQDNRLQTNQGPNGVMTSYAYNQHGQLIRTIVNEQPNGYDPAQPDKHLVTEYGYDQLGRQITTTVGVGTSLSRTDMTIYNADNTIARTIQNYQHAGYDPAQPDKHLVTEYGYDQLGRQSFVKDGLGNYDVTSYASNGQVAATIRNCRDIQGQPTAHHCASFTPAYPDRNVVTRYGYDDLSRTTLITETGILTGTFDTTTLQFSSTTERTTRIEYDALNRPVRVTLNYQANQPDYDPVTGTGRSDINLQELTTYDGAGNVTWQRDALGRWTHTQYDALNHPLRTITNYDDGDPTTPSSAPSSDTDLITEQHYRPDGQLGQRIDNVMTGQFSVSNPTADRTTGYHYDSLGRLTTTIENVLAGSSRTDTNRATTTVYHPLTGQVQGQQDALGRWLSYRYDALGRATETIQNCRDSDGVAHPSICTDQTRANERNVRRQTRYDALGRAIETIDALGQVTHTDYDGLGRRIATTAHYDPDASADTATNVRTRTNYDIVGRVVATFDANGAVTRTSYDAAGRPVAVTDAAGRTTRRGYDARGTQRWTMTHDGRITVSQVDGVGRVVMTIQNYQNGIVEAADGADRDVMTTTSYDAAGRQIATTDAGGRRTAFRYDLRDQLVQVIENLRSDCNDPLLAAQYQPCNVVTAYTYDRAGNRTSITDARNATRRMVYDAADRQTEERDALSRTTRWDYNLLDQPTHKHDPRGSTYDITYLYDELGRRRTTTSTMIAVPLIEDYDALGRRVQVQDETGTTTFQYDALHRITAVQQAGGIVSYGYTARGDRGSVYYPSGISVSYGHTADGQLEAVQDGGRRLAHYTYDNVGRLAQVRRANGAHTTYTYDDLDRLVAQTTHVGDALRSRYTYTLDRTGVRTEVTEAFATTSAGGVPASQQRSVHYRYDGLQRLVEATETPGTSYRYAYDLAGNRTDVWQNGVLAPTIRYDAANQVDDFTYDAAGNLLSDGTRTLTYDALNRVRSVTLADGSATSYRYTIDGILASQTASGSTPPTTTYIQDLATPLSQVLEQQTNATTTVYRYGRERLSAEENFISIWYGTDALGSIRQILTNSGAASAPIHYDPWGTPTAGTPATFGFTGELQDAASDLVYLRARWYLPGRATFASRDPFAGFPTYPYSLHPYQYGYSNPILWTDPSGASPNFPNEWEGMYIGALIQKRFMEGRPLRQVEYKIKGASKSLAETNDGYADLVDFNSGEVYEIKHRPQASAAVQEAAHYIHSLNANGIVPISSPTWRLGTTFLGNSVVDLGLWPYGLDRSWHAQDGYYKIKATLAAPGAVVYWAERIQNQDPRKVLPVYRPQDVQEFIDKTYEDWRRSKWKNNPAYPGPAQPYPGLARAPIEIDAATPLAFCFLVGGTVFALMDGLPGDEILMFEAWRRFATR